MATLSALIFNDEVEAEQALHALKGMQSQHFITIEDAAMVVRRLDGKPKIKQTHHLLGRGLMGGTLGGLLCGLLFFTPLVGAALGAGIGALTFHMGIDGLDDDFLKRVSDEIQPGQTGLFLLTSAVNLEHVALTMKAYHCKLLHTSLSPEDEAKLRETLGAQG